MRLRLWAQRSRMVIATRCPMVRRNFLACALTRLRTETGMRHTITHFSVTENLPECPDCGAATTFANAAELSREKRVYMIFKCTACGAETKVWRPEWQALSDALVAED